MKAHIWLPTGVLSPLTDEIQRSAKFRPKKVHVDKLKNFVGNPPKDWRSPSFETNSEENEGSNTQFTAVGASSESVTRPSSTAKNTGEVGKELEGNVEARCEGIPVVQEATGQDVEKPPLEVSCCDKGFDPPSSNPLSYDCSGEGQSEEVWRSTEEVEWPSMAAGAEVLGTPSLIPFN